MEFVNSTIKVVVDYLNLKFQLLESPIPNWGPIFSFKILFGFWLSALITQPGWLKGVKDEVKQAQRAQLEVGAWRP